MSIVLRNLHAKYELNTTLDKEVIKVLLWLPWHLVMIATRYEADAHHIKLSTV